MGQIQCHEFLGGFCTFVVKGMRVLWGYWGQAT